ncbi:MAG TPA: SH3 domain-containing protein [Xanthobacteraceae bacterium]|nr:SH3 domain-containing protein [Xanthobacteraceae bacterium]
MTPARRLFLASLLAAVTASGAASAADPATTGSIATGSISGLPVPRFVSLKPGKVNVRAGPTKDNDVTWVYTRAGLPVEVTAEFENWRRVRDWEGAEGWVYHSLLSGRRSAIVTPQASAKDAPLPLHADADGHSRVVARLQAGVLGMVKHCTGTWCRIAGDGYDGWIEQDRLWGVYPNEKVE